MANQSAPSAGLIIIGDELLKGRVQDRNSLFLADRLWGVGVRTHRIVIIPDSVTEIAESVRKFSQEYDHVVTTGGVGPTHDDVTFEGVARGLQRELRADRQLIGYLRRQGMDERQATESKMANIPSGAEVSFGPEEQLMSWFPLVRVGNVLVLPGIPAYVRAIWEQVRIGSGVGPLYGEVWLAREETAFARQLEEIQGRWAGRAEIGSYPDLSRGGGVKLTVDSQRGEWLEGCLAEIRAEICPDTLGPSGDVLGPVGPGSSLAAALSILDKLLVMYCEEEICVAFNGGKDCTVLLDLLKRALSHPDRGEGYRGEGDRGQDRLKGVRLLYIRTGETFPEIERFVRETSERTGQEVVRLEGNMRGCLVSFSSRYPRVRAVLMGTRSRDPASERLHPFQSTDSDWPNFLRVMPLLCWSYSEVWEHLRGQGVPYCPLYDQGYTSVGDKGTTQRNPALLAGDRYLPAYQLTDQRRERDGREDSN